MLERDGRPLLFRLDGDAVEWIYIEPVAGTSEWVVIDNDEISPGDTVAAAERLGISVPVVMQQISSRLHIMAMTYFDNRDNIDPYVGGLGYRFSRYVRFGEAWGGRPEYDYITVTVRPPVGSPFEEIDKIIRQYLYFG